MGPGHSKTRHSLALDTGLESGLAGQMVLKSEPGSLGEAARDQGSALHIVGKLARIPRPFSTPPPCPPRQSASTHQGDSLIPQSQEKWKGSRKKEIMKI